ncbi:MAG: hypothetical protein WC139_04015 [Candidatus Kapaibacterium sp.]
MFSKKSTARNIFLAIIALTAFFLGGCEEPSSSDDGGSVPDPVINFNSAVSVNFGSSLKGYISSKGNYNVYRFTSKRGGVIEMKADTVPGNLNLTLDMYDSQKNWLFGNYGATGQTVNLNAVRPPGTYYAVIKDGDNDASSDQPYSFVLNLDSTDIYEYNNTLATARTIGIDMEIQAKIKPESDEDAFQFFSPKDGIVNFTISNVPQNIDIVTDLYDYQNNYIGGITGGTGESYTFGSMLFAGTYFIKLKDGYSDAYSSDFYRIRMNLDTSDYWEINNTFGYAKTIALNQDVSGKIKPVADVDMFKLNVLIPGQMQVAVSQVPPEITMVVELYDSLQVKVANAIGLSNGQPVTLNYTVTRPWMYFVRLSDEYNNDVSDSYFIFKVVR